MAINNNKIERLGLLDRYISSPVYYTRKKMKEQIENTLGFYISDSSFEKDIYHMRDMYDAPIRYCRKKGYYYSEPYDFGLIFLQVWSRSINFDKHLKRKLYE